CTSHLDAVRGQWQLAHSLSCGGMRAVRACAHPMHLRHIAQVTPIAGEAEPRVLGHPVARGPARQTADALDDTDHARGDEPGTEWIAAIALAGQRVAEKFQLK